MVFEFEELFDLGAISTYLFAGPSQPCSNGKAEEAGNKSSLSSGRAIYMRSKRSSLLSDPNGTNESLGLDAACVLVDDLKLHERFTKR